MLLSVLLFSCKALWPNLGEDRSDDFTVSGTVRSVMTGGPLSGAAVTLTRDGETVETTQTSGDGAYSFDGIEAGAGYTVTASASIHIESATAEFAVSGNHVQDITLERQWPSEGPVVAVSVFATSIAFAPDGTIYFTGSNKIRKIAPGGNTAVDYAGTGAWGVADGSLASATFNVPDGIAVSADGTRVYVTDSYGHRVRLITGGVVSTIAGTGSEGGFSGDNGDARQAQLSGPNGVAVDTAGNVYVADRGNNRIRKISAGGTISTIAGGGETEDDDVATSARLYSPRGIAVDIQGNVYITEDHRVRKITGGMISTVFGTTDSKTNMTGLKYPTSIAVDAAGTVYVTDYENSRVVKVLADGTASVVGSTGDGTQATAPSGLAIGPDGALYISYPGLERIMKY